MKKILLTIIVLFCGIFIVPLTSFSQEKVPIRVMLMYDLTGPYSGLQRESDLGARFYMKYWKEHELVKGVEILYDIYDSGTNPDKVRAALMDTLSKKPKPVLALDGLSSSMGLVAKPFGERYHVPILAGSSGRGILFPPSWSFSVQPDYPSLFGAIGKWIKDNWKPDSKISWIREHYQERNPRLGYIGWDNAFGRNVAIDDSINYFKKIGVDFVGAEYIRYASSDTSTNLRRLNKKGMDFVYVCTYAADHATVLKDAERLGIRDTFMDFAFWFTDPRMIQKHAGLKRIRNTVMFTGYTLFLKEMPLFVQNWYTKVLKRGPSDPLLQPTALISWLDLWREVIQLAVNKVGAKNVTGDVTYDIITTKIKGYQPICYEGKQSFSKYKAFGPTTVDVYLFKKGSLVKVDAGFTMPDLSPLKWRSKF